MKISIELSYEQLKQLQNINDRYSKRCKKRKANMDKGLVSNKPDSKLGLHEDLGTVLNILNLS